MDKKTTSKQVPPWSPRTNRFRRSFVTGMRALGVQEDEAQWAAFQEGHDVNGPFEELLSEGKIDEALSIFRAHAPFKEADIQKVPEILERALPSAVTHRLTDATLQDLLYWVQDEVAPSLENESARKCLRQLTFTVARDMAHKALTLDEGTMTKPQVLQTLQLARAVLRCAGNRQSRLDIILSETLDLFQNHGLLRPARVLVCCNEEDDTMNDSFADRYEADIEAMLLRGADNLSDEITCHVKPWCAKIHVDVDAALFTFLADPDLEELARWVRILDHIQDDSIRSKATLLLLRKAAVPYDEYVWTVLNQAKERDAAGRDVWEKETRAMEIRQVASKYDPAGQFELTKHLKILQRHICAKASACQSVTEFEAALADARFISASYDLAAISTCVLQMCLSGPDLPTEDVSHRINVVLQRLSPSERYSVCQEFIQHCLLYCADDDVESRDDSVAEEDILLKVAQYGLATCHYLQGELDASLCYLNMNDCEDKFSRAASAVQLNASGMMNTSTISVDKAASKTTTNVPETCANLDHCIWFTLKCAEERLASACDVLADALLVNDLRLTCDQSLQSSRGHQWEEKNFRDCPNVLNGKDLVSRLQIVLDGSRGRVSNSKWGHTDASGGAKESLALVRMLDSNGATQMGLRVSVHCMLRQPRLEAGSTANDDLLFRLASTALQRKDLDENLIFGYLLSLLSMDSATLLFKAESKRLNDAFVYLQQVKAGEALDARPGKKIDDEGEYGNDDLEDFDYFRFERLSALGKRLGQAFGKRTLTDECDRNESLAKWLSRLTQRNVSFDRLRFLRAQPEYVQIVGNALFMSLFVPTDYSFTKKKLAYLQEYFLDFSFALSSATTTFKQNLARCIVALLDVDTVTVRGLQCELALLQDTLITWAHEADEDELVMGLDRLSLAPCKAGSVLSPQEAKARSRLIMDLLLELAPENESFLRRSQLLGGFSGRTWLYENLLHDPVEELMRIRKPRGAQQKEKPDMTIMVRSPGAMGICEEVDEKELLQSVCIALDLEVESERFFSDYVESLIEKFPESSFATEIEPLLDLITSDTNEMMRLASRCAGIVWEGGRDHKGQQENHVGIPQHRLARKRKQQQLMEHDEEHDRKRTTGLSHTSDRLGALKYVWKMCKRLSKQNTAPPALSISSEELANLVRKLEIRNVYESWGIHFEEEEISRIVDHEKTPLNAIRILFERAGFSHTNTELFEAGKVLVGGNVATLSETLKRLIITWLHLPSRTSKLFVEKDDEGTNDTDPSFRLPTLFSPRLSETNLIFEEKLVKIIARALQLLGGQEDFLRKFAFTTDPKYITSNISRARALRCLQLLSPANGLSAVECKELWRRARMAEFEECKAHCKQWRQTPEQIFGDGQEDGVDKAQALEGLLRDLIPDKANARCLQFVASLIEDLGLHDNGGLLERTCLCFIDATDEAKYMDILDVLLKSPVSAMQQVKSRRIWEGLVDSFTHAVDSLKHVGNADEAFRLRRVRESMVRLARVLERCPFEEIVHDATVQLMEVLSGVNASQFIQKRLQSLYARVSDHQSDDYQGESY